MKINDDITKIINDLVWWIPVKKWRENFRDKFKIRPDQTRPDQTRPNILYSDCIYIYHTKITTYTAIQICSVGFLLHNFC